jgi:hypothetical protein
MQKIDRAPLMAVAAAALLLGAACAPGRTAAARSNPYDVEPFRSSCDGKEVLRVQNSLRESVEIVRLARGERHYTAQPVTVALLSPGTHSLELQPEPGRYFAARTAGSSRYLSTTINGNALQDPSVRLQVQCRPAV